MKPYIGAVLGVAFWFGFWWMTGLDFPSERGALLVFFAWCLLSCAYIGAVSAKIYGEYP